MKILTYILSVYLLLLSVYPCSDENSSTDNTDSGTSVSFTSNKHEGAEACTPFCVCSCCQFSKTCNCIKLKSPEPAAVHYAEEIQQQLSEIYFPIWQPPQLSAA